MLAGRNARYSGNAGDISRPRVFGVILTKVTQTYPLTADELLRRLEACGSKAKLYLDDVQGAGSFGNAMIQMKTQGVTSIFCLCHVLVAKNLGTAATGQAYFPEWLISSYDVQNSNLAMRTSFPSEQLAHLFGIQMVPKQVPGDQLPATWARKYSDPGYVSNAAPAFANDAYRELLILSSGIQMAGPHLTPQTFDAALHKTRFPNPLTPIMAGRVGFGPTGVRVPAGEQDLSFAMTSDAIEFWWSSSAPSPYSGDGNGAMCYVGDRRYTIGEYPTGDDGFFTTSCDTGA